MAVESFCWNTARPSISFLTSWSDTPASLKIRLVSPFPSRIRPSRRCSVSIDTLPSWLAS